MERRARLRDSITLAIQRRTRGHTRLECRVRGKVLLPVNARFFAQRATYDFDCAFFSQVDQPARNSGDGVIHIARGNGNGHRSGCLEEFELDVQTSVGKILAFLRDETCGMRCEPQRADFYRFVLCISRGRKPCCGHGSPHEGQCLAAI